MNFYELTLIMEDEQHKRLEELTKRFKKYSVWNEKELLQFSINAANSAEFLLQFLEKQISQMENDKSNS